MNDRDFLMWIHARLQHLHGEDPCVDYMHRLRAIIAGTNPEQRARNTGEGCNSLEALQHELAR